MNYILGIDQSTQGTKAILVDEAGNIQGRADRPHQQIVNEKGWISHNLEEIYQNVLQVTKDVVDKTGISKENILSIGISNQRETTAIWSRDGHALNDAVVWQCSRAKDLIKPLLPKGEIIREKTGIPLSPYFPAAKMAWLLENTEGVSKIKREDICLGTMDSWLVYRLTDGASFLTDYSNASRTQLLHLQDLTWDKEICKWFNIPLECLPTICDSNSCFGETDLEGYLEQKIPIHGVLGDSHAALFGQGCFESGMIKTTYGTGSSIMMNTGKNCIRSSHGLVTSLAWGIDGKVNYVLEGNINYTGAVVTWLKDDMKLISSPAETAQAAWEANPKDHTVLVPAFTGLSMPYWKNDAEAMLCGMTRITGKNEIIKAALESIALQIQAVLAAMQQDSGMEITSLRVDGGPTKNDYLMQLQSDLSNVSVEIARTEESSALGAACIAGLGLGMYTKKQLLSGEKRVCYLPKMDEALRREKLERWENAVSLV